MRFIHLLVTSAVVIYSCKEASKPAYNQTKAASEELPLPKDSLAFYFPTISSRERVNSFKQNWYSSTLYSFKEPILSQKYVGHNIYRFLWLRSFLRPVVLSIHENDNQVWLIAKILDDYPQFNDERVKVSENERPEYLKAGYVVDSADSNVLVRKADRKANIVYAKRTNLTKRNWDTFEKLVEKAHFWQIPITATQDGMDGSEWIIEAHFANNYRFVDRWMPDGSFKEIGLYLIKLSGLKEEVY
jgi:hypothetical protein